MDNKIETSFQKRRWIFFWSQKKAKIGSSIFIFMLFFSMTASFWSNSKPYILITKQDSHTQVFFPLFKKYSPSDFGLGDIFYMNYKDFVKNNPQSFALFPPNPWDPLEQDDAVLAAPSSSHFLGTDNLGRDILARLLHGTQKSLLFALSLWIISYAMGIFIGAVQGFFIGAFDFILERFKELAAIIPMLTAIILMTSLTQNQSFSLILFITLVFAWMGIASQVRATVLSLRQREFCQASLALGASPLRIIWTHILPNSLTAVITLSPFAIEAGISLLASLDYLGFGLPPPTPSLGELMDQGRDHIQEAPWVLSFPVLTILLLLVSISLIGQALRNAFDPKLN